jgi:hypothetical protein
MARKSESQFYLFEALGKNSLVALSAAEDAIGTEVDQAPVP